MRIAVRQMTRLLPLRPLQTVRKLICRLLWRSVHKSLVVRNSVHLHRAYHIFRICPLLPQRGFRLLARSTTPQMVRPGPGLQVTIRLIQPRPLPTMSPLCQAEIAPMRRLMPTPLCEIRLEMFCRPLPP